jgi:hypothetical protein
VSETGEQIATGSKDGFCRIWSPNSRTGHRVWFHQSVEKLLSGRAAFFVHHQTTPTAIAFLSDREVISGDAAGHCLVWDAADGKHLGSIPAGEGPVRVLEKSGDGKFMLVVTGGDKTCRVFEVSTLLTKSAANPGSPWLVRFLENRRELIVARGDRIDILALKDGHDEPTSVRETVDVSGTVLGAASRDGRYLLAVNYDSTWRLLDTMSGKQTRGKFGNPVQAGAMASVAQDGRLICVFSREIVECIALDDRRQMSHTLAMVPGHMVLNNDGRILIVGVNTRISALPASCVMAVELDCRTPNRGRFSGPFEAEAPLNTNSFLLAGPGSFARSATTSEGHGVLELWDYETLHLRGRREYPGPIRIHDATGDGRWLLLAEPSTSMCHVVDATATELPDRWLLPLTEALAQGAVERDGDLIALAYSSGGVEVFQRVDSQT